MENAIRLLIVEDSEDDAALLLLLHAAGRPRASLGTGGLRLGPGKCSQ